MTCREKLMIEHPECVSHVWVGGCKGCPSGYNYLSAPEYCLGKDTKLCRKCWDREIPGTIKANETVSIEDLIKFVNGLDIDGKMISVSFYEDSTTVTISKFEKELN